MSSPLKQLLPVYRDIEHKVEQAIAVRLGLPVLRLDPEAEASVKLADRVLLVTEQRDLMPPGQPGDGTERDWPDVEPLPYTIEPWPPVLAREAFMKRFKELTEGTS